MPEWPDWWTWELELSPHLLKRMVDRRFNETDLRSMMENATGYRSSQEEPDRYIVETTHDQRPWQVIVEPQLDERILVVVTAYGVSQ